MIASMITIIDEEHEKKHEKLRSYVKELIEKNRDKLAIEDRWAIDVKILCGRHLGASRGSVEWIPDTYEATIAIRCDLPGPLVRWETIHELIELAHYRSGTTIDQFARTIREHGLREVADLFMGHYRVVRNQEIEEDVGRYLGIRRPSGRQYE